MPENPKQNWYQMSAKEVLEKLQSRAGGLTTEEVERRKEQFGANTLPTKPPLSSVKIFLSQLKSPLVYILIIAAILSGFIGEYFDVTIIVLALFINTFVGFWQERKADKTLAKLKKLIQYNVTVQRDGQQKQISSFEVVPGDIMLLQAGDKIIADARVIQENGLQVKEAALTGESYPVSKKPQVLTSKKSIGDQTNMVFMGTIVVAGNARAVVVSTGSSTEVGKIASLVTSTKEGKTPLQLQIIKISKFISALVLVVVTLIFLTGFFKGMELTELLVVVAALAVAAIPEGLLVALTLVLVIGMQRILKKRALMRKLLAAETLGAVSVICSDKTGTITKGQMQVSRLLVAGEIHEAGDVKRKDLKAEEQHLFLLKAGALCNNAYIKNPSDELKDWEVVGDPTETALLLAAIQSGLDKEELNKNYLRIDEIPFNENYKFMATLHSVSSNGTEVMVKGAPEVVLKMCSHFQKNKKKIAFDKKQIESISKEYEQLTKEGLRVLAIAHRKINKKLDSFGGLIKLGEKPKLDNLTFIGWVGLKDPVREDVQEAFVSIRKAGIRPVIITGDHKYTVQAIVKEVGMNVSDDRIVEGEDLNKMDDDVLLAKIDKIDIFARVEPEHKLRIVQAWRKHGATVAMFGDGVNDAPALKAADIGVAVDSGTDVAKETSDMILLDSNFSVVESAIREGRVIFDNIRKIFLYLASDSFTEVILIALALMLNLPLPMTAVQILWINIISDGLPDLALTMEPGEADVMKYPPRPKNESIINKEVKVLIITISSVAVVAVFSLFVYLLKTTGDLIYTQTMVFTVFAIDSIIYVFSVKSLRQPIWKINPFSNLYLVGAVILAILAQFAVVYIPILQSYFKTVPLSVLDWVIVFVLGIIQIMAIETIKWRYWRNKRSPVATKTL